MTIHVRSQLECDVCQKKLSRKDTLSSHRKTHDKTFQKAAIINLKIVTEQEGKQTTNYEFQKDPVYNKSCKMELIVYQKNTFQEINDFLLMIT